MSHDHCAGRTLTGTGFEGDDGSADRLVLRAMADPGDEIALMRALAEARLLVPVVAVTAASPTVPGPAPSCQDQAVLGYGVGLTGAAGAAADDGADGTKEAAMASLTVVRPDGQRALPVFTSISSLAEWHRGARPVPVEAWRAAQAAITERCDVLLVDLGQAWSVVLRPSMLWALAQRRAWAPAHEDPFVGRAVQRAVREEAAVADVALEQGEPVGDGVLRVVLTVRPGLDARAVESLATRVGRRIAADGETRARIDAITFALRPT